MSKSSLTAPRDALTSEQLTEAVNTLYIKDYVDKFPRVERVYADPIYNSQFYSLHSFIPAKGATPDPDGIYGMVKFRGAFPTVEEANKRAEFIIENVDSYHPIYTGYIGRPFPLANNPKYASETKEVDVRKKVTEVIDQDVQKKRQEERNEIKEIQEREKRLKEESSKPEDSTERYTTLRVKKAQLIWTYYETKKKLGEMITILKKTDEEINQLEAESEEYKKVYKEKYMQARRDAGLKDDDNSFIKYMCDDIEFKE